MVRRGNSFYVRNSNSSGPAEITVAYGDAGDTVLVGDWNGDGIDTLAVRRGNTYFVKNSISSGVADTVFALAVTDFNIEGDLRRGFKSSHAPFMTKRPPRKLLSRDMVRC